MAEVYQKNWLNLAKKNWLKIGYEAKSY